MSFNPREALERIRQSKASASKADSQSVQQHSNSPILKDNISQYNSHQKNGGLFPEYIESNQFDEFNTSGFASSVQKYDNNILQQLMKKVQTLEKTTSKLSKELAHSQQVTTLMRKQKSVLQNQILKLESENKQLKSEKKRKQTTKTTDQILKDSKLDSAQKVSIAGGSQQQIRDGPKLIDDSLKIASKCSLVSQQLLQPIITEPLDKILQKKQKNFRALKNNNRIFLNQSKELHQLAKIFKQYPNMEKPTIQIDISSLNKQDFDVSF